MRRALISATLTGLLLLSACGGDDEESSSTASEQDSGDDNNDSGDSGDSDETVPEISVGNIPGVSDECEELYSAWLTLFAGASVPGAAVGDVDATIEALQSALPDELDDDAAVFGEAISKYFTILAKYDNDSAAAFADPEVQAVLEELGSDEVTEASNNIGAYFEEACPAAG